MADRNTKDMLQQESKQLPDIEISEVTIKKLIYMIRGQQVMLDSDLAMLYQVETGNLNNKKGRCVGLKKVGTSPLFAFFTVKIIKKLNLNQKNAVTLHRICAF